MYLLALLLACETKIVDVGDTEPTFDTDAPPTLPPEPTVPPETTFPAVDEALARDIISGAVDPDLGFQQLADSSGLPVATATGWLFLYRADGGPWATAGSFSDWVEQPMTLGANDVWWVELSVEEPAGALYKFTDAADWLADPWARSYTYDDLGEISFVRPPTDASRLDRWPGRAGHGMAPRTVRAYVPPGNGPFPVMYAHDGQNLFDPGAFWGGWQLQAALATVDPMIVVGIDNTADRFAEYTHVPDDLYGYPIGGDGTDYAAFVTEDLRPHIQAEYATSGHDGIMGSSLGGLISLHVAQTYPGDYDFVASLSGTLGWGSFGLDNPVMEELYLAHPPGFAKVYVDSGGGAGSDGVCTDGDGDGFVEDDRDDADNYCINRQFADDLAAAGWTYDVDLWHWHEVDAQHNEAYWADRVDQPLAIFAALDD